MEGIINFHNHIMFFLVGTGIFVVWLTGRRLSLYNIGNNKNDIDNFIFKKVGFFI